MKKSIILAVSGAFLVGGLCRAQSDAPYTEGPIWQITMVKTKPGMSDDYLKGIAKTFKGTLDEAKKQNLIMDYKVLIGDSANGQDFDILLMTESKNMASLDNSREKFDPIARKVEGDLDQQRATQVKRLEIRDILGSKLMREVTLK
jgi:hypothetical protein